MDRMAKGTKDPATLNELFEALNNDPYLIAECLARPVLADRLVRNWYANDERFHKETRGKAEEALKHLTPENFCSYPESQYSKIEYQIQGSGGKNEDGPISTSRIIKLDEQEYLDLLNKIPKEGEFSEIVEDEHGFDIIRTISRDNGSVTLETLSFEKEKFSSWLERQGLCREIKSTGTDRSEYSLVPVTESLCTGGWWPDSSLDSVPGPRTGHTAIWTGTEMIVWGGDDTGKLDTGGRYHPSTDSWIRTSAVDAPLPRTSHTAVWTGSVMIVWGGMTDSGLTETGGKYDPVNDSWSYTSVANGPTARQYHSAVWTGTAMIIWGGWGAVYPDFRSDGFKYDPGEDGWQEISASGFPSGRGYHTAVWTGTEMIVWGGWGTSPTYKSDGGRYNPSNDSWTATPTGGNCPSERINHTAVWTGTEMIIWGGNYYTSTSNYLNTGARFNPITNAWQATTTTGALSARGGHAAVWTGSEMIVWGGGNSTLSFNSGSRYDPVIDSWTAISSSGAPSRRRGHTAVWTGTEMIVWGAVTSNGPLSGGRYSPSSDTWVETSTGGGPSPRYAHSAVWTGAEMIIWGGYYYLYPSTYYLNTGARYDAALDAWTAISTGSGCPESREWHSAIWTGSQMIVWGGRTYTTDYSYLNTGGRYSPAGDTWSLVTTTGAPAGRDGHAAIWTGSQMVVWGGFYSVSYNEYYLNTGGRYNPSANSWSDLALSGAPSARGGHTGIWTGTQAVFWGGQSGSYPDYVYFDTGGIYTPSSNSWAAVPVPGTLAGRSFHTALWTGTKMLVWGGSSSQDATDVYLDTGGLFEPSASTWEEIPTSGAPAGRCYHTAVWTGAEMIVWGGYTNMPSTPYDTLKSGGRYNVSTSTWYGTSEVDAPSRRMHHTAVWIGTGMVVWGGWNQDSYYKDGGIFRTEFHPSPYITGSATNNCPSSYVSLSIPASYVSYQWNLNGSPISGATANTYEATVSGSYTVSVTDSNGCSGTSDSHVVTITPCIPNIVYSAHGSFTEATGDGDSYFERGEKWSVPVTVTNSGNTPASNVTAVFSGNGITVCNPTGSFGTIAAGGTGTFTYSFVIDDDFTPCGGNINFNLGSKACTELTPAGADETNLFSIQVGQIAAGVPTDLVLQPSTADSYVNQGSAGTNYGSGATMSVQSRLSQAQRTLVMFDLSAIPENSVINSATLELYASSAPTTGLTLNVHRITGTWTESGVTWTNQPAYNSTVDSSLAGGTAAGWKIWNIASVVQGWVDGTNVNYGLIVKGSVENDKTSLTYTFSSKENGTSGNRPSLRINYTPPAIATCEYVGIGECSAPLPGEAAPGDIYENGQTWSGTSQSWPALTGATGYKLYRGIQSGLPNLLTADNDSCLRYEGSTTSVDLSPDDPSSETGRLYWYIVTAINGSGEGPSGNGRIVNSSGNCE